MMLSNTLSRFGRVLLLAVALTMTAAPTWAKTPKITADHVKQLVAAAEKGDAEAQYWVGICYLEGVGVKKSGPTAQKWLKKAGHNRYIDAQRKLAFLYRDGKVIPQSDENSFYWFKKAADNKDPVSMTMLGLYYYQGTGVKKSTDEAKKWLQRAAKAGDKDAVKFLEKIEKGGK